MEQESISKKRIGIIGAGPSGCACAKFLLDFGFQDITIFDKKSFLQTILPTGGGRCNLAHAEFDFKELAKNYPRGEKFLYSILSKFGTQDTINFFNSIGIETYIQEDNRIFPISNSSEDVRKKLLKAISKCKNQKESVSLITKLKQGYELKTNKAIYFFDYIVIAIGGHSGYQLIKNLNIPLINPTQALVGLKTEEDLSELSGVKVSHTSIKIENKTYYGDLLFTHKGVSGPVIYTISSIFARKDFPYQISINLANIENFQNILNKNPHKTLINILKEFIPKSVASYIINKLEIDFNLTGSKINSTTRDNIVSLLKDFRLTIKEKMNSGEVVTCGGVDLKEVNPKTLESKSYEGLYFCGEILDIDGLCGGFNLQNCWSTAFVVAEGINNNSNL